jgi:hypothetical protein
VAVSAGAGVAAAVTAIWPLGLGAVAVALPIAALALLSRRRPATGQDDRATAPGCGCGEACATRDTVPIACTLGADDFKERTEWIRNLSRHSLLKADRSPLTLSLTYRSDATSDVDQLVAKERACCSFLDFDIHHDPEGIRLRITAPPDAGEVADILFDHFAPDLARQHGKEPV